MFKNLELDCSVRAIYLVLMKTDSPLELSQDLISQVSEAESSHDDHRGQIRIKEMSKGRHKGIGPIDISEFRLPAVVSVNSRYVSRVIKSTSGIFFDTES